MKKTTVAVQQYSSTYEGNSVVFYDEYRFASQVLAAMERLHVTVKDVKATHFKTDDIGAKMRELLGDASLAQHSLATEQPVGAACLVSGTVVSVCRLFPVPAVHV